MSAKYRFCEICRGPDELIHCCGCRKGYHIECVSLLKKPDASWQCSQCMSLEEEEGDGAAKKKYARKRSPTCLQTVNKWRSLLNVAQRKFIIKQRDMFEAFCERNKLDSLISSYKSVYSGEQRVMLQESVATDFTSLTETPAFITGATLRDYQLTGVSEMCSWYLRGVGGILGEFSVLCLWCLTVGSEWTLECGCISCVLRCTLYSI